MNDAGQPDIEFDADGPGDVFRAVSGGWYALRRLDARVYVPEGTATDLASVPRLFRWSVSKTALGVRAPLVHDMLYGSRGSGQVTDPEGRTFTRKEADMALRDLALEDGTSRYTATKAYLALRVGGWWVWHRMADRMAFWR